VAIIQHGASREAARDDTYYDLGLDTVGLKHRSGSKLELKLRQHSVGHSEDWNKVYTFNLAGTVGVEDLKAAFVGSTHTDAYRALEVLESVTDLAPISVVISKERILANLHNNALFEAQHHCQIEQTTVTVTLPGTDAPQATQWRSVCVEGSDLGSMPNVMDWLVSGWSTQPETYLIMGYPQFIRHVRGTASV
jgi:hypothetical protein